MAKPAFVAISVMRKIRSAPRAPAAPAAKSWKFRNPVNDMVAGAGTAPGILMNFL